MGFLEAVAVFSAAAPHTRTYTCTRSPLDFAAMRCEALHGACSRRIYIVDWLRLRDAVLSSARILCTFALISQATGGGGGGGAPPVRLGA